MKLRNSSLIWIASLVILTSIVCGQFAPQESGQPVDVDATLVVLEGTQTALAAASAPTSTNLPPPTESSPPTQILPTEAPAPTESLPGPNDGFGRISGNLYYPSEGIPPLWVVAFSLDTDEYYFIGTETNQQGYVLDNLPVGAYYVVAYPQDDSYDIAGGYTEALYCNCDDHSLLEVYVNPGEDTPGIDMWDWYAPEGHFPPNPFVSFGPENPHPEDEYGSISGSLSFPSEGIPALRVVAFNLDTGRTYYVNTSVNQSVYILEELPPGAYYVVAYDASGFAGGYTAAVLCGLGIGCDDHSLIEVYVDPGQETYGIDLWDWYAPDGAFPPPP